MKYIVILIDGMADEAIDQLGGRTPLAAAYTPNLDQLAPSSEVGMVKTIPVGCAKGSDTANLSVLGYDPKRYYFGRSPLEALSIGVSLRDTDVTFRANVVTLSEAETDYHQKQLIDHSADEITTEEADGLIAAVQDALGDEYRKFFTGVSYRHLLVWNHGSTKVKLTPPHDILGQTIGDYQPTGEHAAEIWDWMQRSYEVLNHHPINEARRARGLHPANSLWIWGEGTKPLLPAFKEKYGIDGAVISAVDLLKGIGIGANMVSIDVVGATGNMHTNYEGKTQAALDWLLAQEKDFIYIHLEGPDECGHRAELANKIKCMELIDEKVVGPIISGLQAANQDFKLLVVPDHPTPIRLRTHTGDAVPYLIYNSRKPSSLGVTKYCEKEAAETGQYIDLGYELMTHFIKA